MAICCNIWQASVFRSWGSSLPDVAQVAIDKGIPTLTEFFGVDCAKQLLNSGRAADLVIGNNVLAQVPTSTISWAAFKSS